MRLSRWLPLLGLLALAAAREPPTQGDGGRTQSTVIHLVATPFLSAQSRTAQDRLEALVDLASLSQAEDVSLPNVNPELESEAASHKQGSGGILGAVEAVVSSLTSGSSQTEKPQPPETSDPSSRFSSPFPSQGNQGEGEGQGEEEEGVGGGERCRGSGRGEEGITNTPTESNAEEEETTEEAKPLTKGERKAVNQYNGVTDQVLNILSVTLAKVDPLPLTLDQKALEALEEEEETSPEPEPEPSENKNRRKRKKNRKNKNKRKRGEAIEEVVGEEEEEVQEVEEEEVGEEGQRKKHKRRKNKNDKDDDNGSKRKRNRRKKNKKRKNKGDSEDEEEVEEKGKKNKRERNNKRKKNKRNKNNNKRNKTNRRNKAEDIELHREGKALSAEDDEGAGVTVGYEQGRRKNSRRKNKKGGKKNKRKRGKKGKKGNKRGKKGNRGRLDMEEEIVETGPVYPTPEEQASANAVLAGLTRLARTDEVTLDRNTNRDLFTARVAVGPLAVRLSQQGRAMNKARVTADVTADITFKIRSKGRRMQVIKVKEVTMGDLTSDQVTVARSDLVLQPEVIDEAKNQVLAVVDVPRIGRIIRSELEAIFSEDDLVQNLPHHKFLHQ